MRLDSSSDLFASLGSIRLDSTRSRIDKIGLSRPRLGSGWNSASVRGHRVPVLIMRLSTLNQCIASGDPSAAAFAYGNCTYDDGPYVPSPRVTGGLLDGDWQTEVAAKLWRTHCARRLARATRSVVGLLCFAPYRRIVHCVHYGVRDTDRRLGSGVGSRRCLPYIGS
jgi:hypothetical protein